MTTIQNLMSQLDVFTMVVTILGAGTTCLILCLTAAGIGYLFPASKQWR